MGAAFRMSSVEKQTRGADGSSDIPPSSSSVSSVSSLLSSSASISGISTFGSVKGVGISTDDVSAFMALFPLFLPFLCGFGGSVT